MGRRAWLAAIPLLCGLLATSDGRERASGQATDHLGRPVGQLPIARRPSREISFLQGVHWVDVNAEGGVVLEGWADAVNRRPRRSGVFTLLSYQEIVAVNVRLRLGGARPEIPARRRSEPDSGVFQHVQGTIEALRTMVRDEGRQEGERTALLTRTFPGGTVLERLSLEGLGDDRRGRLWSQRLTAVPGSMGWLLEDVRIEPGDGRRLTTAAARWTDDGRLVASGPYVLEAGMRRQAGTSGCFAVRPTGPIRFQRLSAERDAMCASPAGPAAADPFFSALSDALRRPETSAARAERAALVEQLLRVSAPSASTPELVAHMFFLLPLGSPLSGSPPAPGGGRP